MSNQLKLSIVIANWNTRELLRGALQSIQGHPPLVPYEVIVVDNGSTDRSGELLAREFSWVHAMQNTVNEGYAKAVNQGAESSRGEFILLLGSDTVVLAGSLQRMVEYLEGHDGVGGVSCRLLNPDRSLQASCRTFPTLWDAAATYLSLHALAPSYNVHDFDFYKTQEVDQPAATCFMLKRSVVHQVGLFDERLSILYNDVDLCRRIRTSGWKIVFLADAEIIHYGSSSTRQATPEVRLEMYRNILLYYVRQFGKKALVVLLPILTVRLAIVNKGKFVGRLFSFRHLS